MLANGYSDLFGDYWGDVWRTVNPLFIGSSGVAAVTLWRCGCPAGRVGAVVSVAMGTLVFANGYFVNNEVSGRYWTRCGCLRHWSGPPAPARRRGGARIRQYGRLGREGAEAGDT